MADARTSYPLGHLMVIGKYNARHIRKLILSVHDDIGLPHLGFYFEQGVCSSRWIDGTPRPGSNCMDWRETEGGLQGPPLGLRVRHATTPRAKTIENMLRHLQEGMRPEPGFVGFNERTDKRERMQDFLNRV